MTPQNKEELDQLARMHQMKINTRLTALQAAQTLMSTLGYLGVAGEKQVEGQDYPQPVWINKPGTVDHITLLAMAGDIEAYILGNLEKEAVAAMEEAKKPPKPNILQVRQ